MIPGQAFSSDFCKIPRRPWTFCYSFTITERRTEGGVHQEYCFITQLKVPLALKAPPPGAAAGWLGEVSIFSPFLRTIPFSKHVKENCSFSKWSPPSGKRPPPSYLRSSSHRVTGSCHQLTLRWWQAFFTCCSPPLRRCCVLFLWMSSGNPSYKLYGADAVLQRRNRSTEMLSNPPKITQLSARLQSIILCCLQALMQPANLLWSELAHWPLFQRPNFFFYYHRSVGENRGVSRQRLVLNGEPEPTEDEKAFCLPTNIAFKSPSQVGCGNTNTYGFPS